MEAPSRFVLFFFFNDTATTEIYTLSLHDALPIFALNSEQMPEITFRRLQIPNSFCKTSESEQTQIYTIDRKSTRLNSSHANISYAVFCLKKTKRNIICHGSVKLRK